MGGNMNRTVRVFATRTVGSVPPTWVDPPTVPLSLRTGIVPQWSPLLTTRRGPLPPTLCTSLPILPIPPWQRGRRWRGGPSVMRRGGELVKRAGRRVSVVHGLGSGTVHCTPQRSVTLRSLGVVGFPHVETARPFAAADAPHTVRTPARDRNMVMVQGTVRHRVSVRPTFPVDPGGGVIRTLPVWYILRAWGRPAVVRSRTATAQNSQRPTDNRRTYCFSAPDLSFPQKKTRTDLRLWYCRGTNVEAPPQSWRINTHTWPAELSELRENYFDTHKIRPNATL